MSNDDHLSHIVTLWSVVQRAHQGQAESVQSAQRELLERYGGAIRRYLLACLKNQDAADEVFQEFALRFVRGDFHKAHPDQGRFRSFLKTVVYRLVVDYQRRQGREARQHTLAMEGPTCEAEEQGLAEDEQFRLSWRDDLLTKSWNGLEELGKQQGKPYYQVLRLRAEHPELRSPELAARLSTDCGKTISAGNIRVLLHRARQRFAELLLEQVSHSLNSADPEQIEQELIELNLHGYCRDVLRNRDQHEI